ncbi:TonB-dependent receptor family protein [Hyphomonas sp.]|uniref:TonB-dependent receptor family protein n=1 Tax=Hyphomonas sp. TaxID=87 RepID=UPI0035621F4F
MNNLKNGSAMSLVVLGAMLGYAPLAVADDAMLYQDTIIVTSNARTLEAEALVAKTAGGADIVSHDDYADRFLVSLRDTLAFSPGVYTQPRYGQEVRISIRGSGLSRGYHMRGLTLLQDGAPINLADDNGDFQELEPIFFDHLEVFRGANALRFGSGTLGGAINGVTPTGRTAPGVYVRGDLGSNDTARLLVSGGVAGDQLDGWAALSTDTSDGDRDHAARGSVRFHGNLGYAFNDKVTTRFYASVNQINQELPGALTRAPALSDPKTGNFFGDQGRDVDSLRVQNQTMIDLGSSQLKVGVFLNGKSLFHPIFQVIDQETLDRGGFARWDWAGNRFEATVGAEARFGEVDYKRYVNNNGASGALTFDAAQEAFTSNVYSELRYHATDKLTLIGGGIYANGKREQFEKYNMFAGGPTGVKGEKAFNAFSPKFGALYQATPDIQFYGNLSKSAEFPGFGELAQLAAFVPVEKQTAWTLEAGTRGRASMAEWDITIYRSQLDGELLQYTIGPDVPASTFNADETVHQGIEAGLSLALNDWLHLRQVYTWSDFTFSGDGQYGDNTLPVVPEHVYRAELRIGTDSLHASPSLEWVIDGPCADYNNTTKLDGYVLLGATASWSITETMDLFLDARNLTDENAIGDVSAVITADPASAIYYPVERRALFGGIRARF